MTASHAIFPFASVCNATTWQIPIQISDVLCLGHAYLETGIYWILVLRFPMLWSSTNKDAACFPHIQRIPKMSRNLTGQSGWLKGIGGVNVDIRLSLKEFEWSCDEPIWNLSWICLRLFSWACRWAMCISGKAPPSPKSARLRGAQPRDMARFAIGHWNTSHIFVMICNMQ